MPSARSGGKQKDSFKEFLVGIHSGYGLEKPQRQARFRNFRILAAGASE